MRISSIQVQSLPRLQMYRYIEAAQKSLTAQPVTPNNLFKAMPQNKPPVYLTFNISQKKHVALPLLASLGVFCSFQWKLKTLALVAPVHSRNPAKPLWPGHPRKKTDPPNKGGHKLWGHIDKTCPWNMPGINPGKDAYDVSFFHWKSCHCHWMSMFIPQKKRIQEVHYLKQTTNFTPEIAIPEFYNERSLNPLFPQGLCNLWWRHQHHFIPAPLACFFCINQDSWNMQYDLDTVIWKVDGTVPTYWFIFGPFTNLPFGIYFDLKVNVNYTFKYSHCQLYLHPKNHHQTSL